MGDYHKQKQHQIAEARTMLCALNEATPHHLHEVMGGYRHRSTDSVTDARQYIVRRLWAVGHSATVISEVMNLHISTVYHLLFKRKYKEKRNYHV